MVSAKSAEQEKTLQDRLEHPQQENPSGGGRHAAGEDPVKRERILDGAKRVFMRSSFDAASMNDITREAGVSKGTLYVYFENKEDLFTALIARERNIIVNSVKQSLNGNEPIEEALHAFGVKLVTSITSDYTIRAMRTVLGVIDRMPRLAQRFFTATPENGYTVLKAYLDQQVSAGMLSIEDTEIAAKAVHRSRHGRNVQGPPFRHVRCRLGRKHRKERQIRHPRFPGRLRKDDRQGVKATVPCRRNMPYHLPAIQQLRSNALA